MIKMAIEDNKCELELRGTSSEAIHELIMGVEQSIEAFSRITGADKDVAAATIFSLVKARQKKEEKNEH